MKFCTQEQTRASRYSQKEDIVFTRMCNEILFTRAINILIYQREIQKFNQRKFGSTKNATGTQTNRRVFLQLFQLLP